LWTTRAGVTRREKRNFMPDSPDRPHRTGNGLVDIIVATCAVFISVASLWVALRADHTQEALLKSSVWPYVEFDSSDLTAQGKRYVSLQLRNEGIGPAIVRSFAVQYAGKFYPSLHELLQACCDVAGEPRLRVRSSTVHAQVIMAHEVFPFIVATPSAVSSRSYERLHAKRFDFSIRMCYCSVLGDCWFLDSREDQPRPVSNCPPAQQPQYLT
jgi:hypothetical protein